MLRLLLAGLCAGFFLPAFALQPAQVDIKADPGVTVKVTRNKTNTSKQISITVNQQDVVTVTKALPPVDMQVGLPADPRTFPAADPGVLDERVRFTGQMPGPSEEGGFRTACTIAKVRADDPIVYPGRPGASHLHTFFGNGSIDAMSTDASMLLGGSTCRGGRVNPSGYWQPSMLDGPNFVRPQSMISYYKNGARLPSSTVFTAPPRGFKMVAGNPNAKTAAEAGGLFTCIDASGSGAHFATIPACAPGNTLWASVEFPQCWDGKNLDSPDHRSHVSYPAQLQQFPFTWSCPATHPVAIPLITINVLYAIKPGDDTKRWKLSCDMGAAGTCLHADWWNQWKPDVMATWVANCNNAHRDCEAHMLGDGRVLDEFGGN